ncbi:DUF6195 family protein [Streptomyces niveiscabiei]|uniref:DUF6195 family protein n=1 Tax=Streptomyces niveiscabiei TaxID=164115 RepID=UPI000B0EE2F8|nr:DUF6195 family protein [Streptomyces niveiscabiei]
MNHPTYPRKTTTPMPHPLMLAAASKLVRAEQLRSAARTQAFHTWGTRAVTAASKHARRLLGDEAVTLKWEALGVLHPDDLLQAIAPLGTVAGQRLELHYSGDGKQTERLALRRSCGTCPAQHLDDVDSLEHLGRLLARTPAWPTLKEQA